MTPGSPVSDVSGLGVKPKPALDNHMWKTQHCDCVIRSSNSQWHLPQVPKEPGAKALAWHRCSSPSELYPVSELLNLRWNVT